MYIGRNRTYKLQISYDLPKMFINGKQIGVNNEPYIIAELSANHCGSIELAKETIKLAKNNGADAIKIQTYTANSMTLDCDKEDFIIKEGTWKGYKLYDLYKEDPPHMNGMKNFLNLQMSKTLLFFNTI